MCLDFADTPFPANRKHFQPHQKSEAEREREDILGVAQLKHKALEILGKGGHPLSRFRPSPKPAPAIPRLSPKGLNVISLVGIISKKQGNDSHTC